MAVLAPNAIFLGDRSETQCQVTNVCVGTSMVNPGCFVDDGSFAIYNLAKVRLIYPSARGGNVKQQQSNNVLRTL